MKQMNKELLCIIAKESYNLDQLVNDLLDIKSLCSRNENIEIKYSLITGNLNKLNIKIFL
jgi:signal transduction histidine kinase